MMRSEARILGEAAFGTADGLTVQGNGVLADARTATGVLEFHGYGPELRILQGLGREESAVFRRRVADNGGAHYEIIGVLSTCRDRHGRLGFMGGAVAIEPDSVSPQLRIQDWRGPIERAADLWQALQEFLDPDTGRFSMPPSPLVESDRASTSVRLTPLGDRHVSYCKGEGSSETLLNDLAPALQAMSFVSGEKTPTIIYFHKSIDGLGRIDDESVRAQERKMADRVAHRKAELERQVAEREPTVRDVASSSRAVQQAGAGGSAGWPEKKPTLEEITARVSYLERQVGMILDERQLGGPARRNAARQTAETPSSFGVFDQPPRAPWRLVVAVVAALGFLAALGVVLFLLWPDSGPGAEETSTTADAEPGDIARSGEAAPADIEPESGQEPEDEARGREVDDGSEALE